MSEPKIYAAMCAAMAHIGAVTKSKINQQQHFNYRGIDDVMNALYPVLSAHGLFLAPEVLEHSREERTTKSGGNLIYSIMKIRYTMYASDGSSVSATVIGEGMDSADKSSNKAMAVAMKYAMFQLFCIPTEEMAASDPDRETPPESTPCDSKYKAYQNPVNRREHFNRLKDAYHVTDAEIQNAAATAASEGKLQGVNGSLVSMSDADFLRTIDIVEQMFKEAA